MSEQLQQVLANLPKIMERAEKATPGPWFEERNFAVTFIVKHTNYSGVTEHICHMGGIDLDQSWNNGQFIAHAREDVPKLCDALQEVAAVREPVRWFAGQMEATLKKNDHKGGWDECSYKYLFTRMKEELLEIQDVVFKRNPDFEKLICECTDVANFAMMIADLARKKVEA